MNALWADGPHKGEVVTLRTSVVVADEHRGGPLEWMDPTRPVDTTRTIYRVMLYPVGDRAWRVLVPEGMRHPDTTTLHLLIDTDPAVLRQVEVRA